MSDTADPIAERLTKLGLECDSVPRDSLSSAMAALSCFPMYMVANVHAWTKGEQWSIPLVDVPGFEAIREAFVIGREEKHLDLQPAHRHLLGTLLGRAKPSDRVIYEYALDTLAQFLQEADPHLAEQIRTAVAHMIVRVAQASGDGLLGSGEKVSRHEYQAIQHIAEVLQLRDAKEAAGILQSIED